MVMFDCGAHIGEYTLVAAALVGTKGQVHAFEPDYRTFQFLEENVRMNELRQVTLNPSAVGEQSGEITLRLSTDPTASSAVLDNETIGTVNVPMLCLDEYIIQHGIRPN